MNAQVDSLSIDTTQAEMIAPTPVTPVDSSIVKYILLDDYLSFDVHEVDTSLVFIHQYNPAKRNKLYVTRGNLGFSHQNILFAQFDPYNDLFDVGETSFPSYYYNWKLNPIYFPLKPISEVSYTSGSNEEQYLDFTLSNKVSKTVYLNLDLQVQSGLGAYKNQKISNNQFRFNTSYTSKNKKLYSLFTYTKNKFKTGENGGILSDRYYEDTVFYNRQVIPVNLSSAYNDIRTNAFFFRQTLNLGKSDDTTIIAPLGQLFIDVVYQKKSRVYYDEDLIFYDNRFIDSIQSFDSISTKMITTRLGWQNSRNILNKFYTKFWLEYQLNEYYNNLDRTRYDYLNPNTVLAYNGKKLAVKAWAKYSILTRTDGLRYGDNNYSLIIKARQRILDGLYVDGSFTMAQKSPNIQLLNTYSNHYMWDNKGLFVDENSLALSAGVTYSHSKFSVSFSDVANYTSLFDSIGPTQSDNNLKHFSLQYENDYRFKNFGFNTLLAYQNVNNSAVYSLPTYAGRLSLYTYFHLFKRVLKIEPGVELYAHSTYYAPYYDASLGSFVQQREKEVDNQFYADFYINFKIKKARIFVKYEHFNSLFMNYNYFLTTHYPMQDAGLKFGVSWKFYD